MFEIQKDIPKAIFNGRGRPQKYPFNNMSVGDSFFVENGAMAAYCKPYNAMMARNGKRKVDINAPLFRAANENGGIRIWRVE